MRITGVTYNAPSEGLPEGLYESPWGLYTLTVEIDGRVETFEAEALLNATGRAPNVHDLGLEMVRSVLIINVLSAITCSHCYYGIGCY